VQFITCGRGVVVCLFHGDYGPADPGFSVSATAPSHHGWSIDTSLLTGARNLREAEAIQRHVLRGETVMWCHPGYSWVDQPAIGWFYIAAFVFVVLPYLAARISALSHRVDDAPRRAVKRPTRLRP
jgi:hypothetical protein